MPIRRIFRTELYIGSPLAYICAWHAGKRWRLQIPPHVISHHLREALHVQYFLPTSPRVLRRGHRSVFRYRPGTCTLLCAAGLDLLIALDEPEIEAAAIALRHACVSVIASQVDFSTLDGVDRLVAAVGNRPVDCLLAIAGRGLGHAFVDEAFSQAKLVLDTNVTGTIYLIHRLAGPMRARESGRILVTGSIAGFMPGLLPGGLHRHKGFPRFVLARLAQRVEGFRRNRELPHARTDGHPVLRACGHARYESGTGRQDSRPSRSAARRLRGDAEWRGGRGGGL